MKPFPALLLLLTACANPFDAYDTDEMQAVVTNRSGQTIAKVGLYARQFVGNRQVFTDSVLAYNLAPGTTRALTAHEDRVQPQDGDFALLVTLKNGTLLQQETGYFTNGSFLLRAIEFEVRADTIRILKTEP